MDAEQHQAKERAENEFDSNNKEMNSNMWNKEQQIGSTGTITFALPL